MREKWNSENLKHSLLWFIFSVVAIYYSLFSLAKQEEPGINWIYYLTVAFCLANSFFSASNISRDLKLQYWVNNIQLSHTSVELPVEATLLKSGQITSLKINGVDYPVANEDPGRVIIRVIKMNNRISQVKVTLVVEFVPWPVNKYFLHAYSGN